MEKKHYGFFGHFQERLSNDMNIPVAVSSLVQIPWIRTIIRKDQKIGILTANAAALGEQIYHSCGIGDAKDLVVADLRYGENFSVIMEDRGTIDNAGGQKSGGTRGQKTDKRTSGYRGNSSGVQRYAALCERGAG